MSKNCPNKKDVVLEIRFRPVYSLGGRRELAKVMRELKYMLKPYFVGLPRKRCLPKNVIPFRKKSFA